MALTGTLVDNFDGGSVDTTTRWSIVVVGTSAVSLSSGRLKLDTSGSGSFAVLEGKTGSYNLTGSYVFLQLVSAGTRAAGSTFQLALTDLNVSGNANGVVWDLTNTTLTAYWVDNTGSSHNLATATYNSTTHQWLRIRESGGTIFWDYSSDGITWNNLTSVATSSTPITTLSIDNYNINNTAGSVTMLIDNFNTFITPRTQTGVSRISATTLKTNTGKARIQIKTVQTQTGKSRISATTLRTQTGKAAITQKGIKTITGVAKIQLIRQKNQTGVSKIIVYSVDHYTKPYISGIRPDDKPLNVVKDYQGIKDVVKNI